MQSCRGIARGPAAIGFCHLRYPHGVPQISLGRHILREEITMTTQTITVSGMSCGYCVEFVHGRGRGLK